MPRLRMLVAASWVAGAIAVPLGAAPGADAQGAPGVDATGASDVTAALQALVDSTPDGGVVRLEAGADYRVEGTIVLEDRHDLVIEGNGARIFATTRGDHNRSQLKFVGGSDLVVRNVEIQGANPHAGMGDLAYNAELEAQHGISLVGVTDVEVAGVNIHDTYGDHVYVALHPDDRRWSERVWVHDSTFARSGRQGIAVVAARDVVIERNSFTDMRRATIDLEPGTPEWGAENIHILDNDVGPGRLLFVAAAGGGPVNNVVVARNEVRGRSLGIWVHPPEGVRRQGFWVVDNTSDTEMNSAVMWFKRTDGVVVRGNRQPMDGADPLVTISDSCDVTVTGNDIAPGTLALRGENRRCGRGVALAPPAPPQVAGRGDAQDEQQAAPPTTAPPTTPPPETTTTSQAPRPTTTPPAEPPEAITPDAHVAASTDSGGDGIGVPVLIGGAVLAALALAGAGTLIVRRARP